MNRAKRLASKRRYRQSAKGKRMIARYAKNYRKTIAAENAHKRYYAKRKESQVLKKEWYANFKRWVMETPTGRAYWKRHNLELPSVTPREFLDSIEFLNQLRRYANEHNRA